MILDFYNSMVDVLNLEWTSYPSRDRNAASLVCNYLRYQGLSVWEGSIFEGFQLIDRIKPRLVFLTNTTGATINFYIAKYASLKGIKVVSLTSEGNFYDDADLLDQFLWGWNNEKVLYENINMQWSSRTKKMTLDRYPNLKSKILVSGSCGIDIYKILPRVSKDTFLKKYNKIDYKNIVGVGCWDFDIAYPNGRCYDYYLSLYGEESLKRFRNDRDSFNKILLKAVENNPNVLFLLKEHPGNLKGLYMSGIDGLERFKNVLILKNESIVDCISVSDFWMTYESTTVFEAWFLEKQTCLLNPSGIDFPRANVFLGSPNYLTYEEFQNAIDVWVKEEKLLGFKEKKTERDKAIRDSIQWDDGFNHVRAGNEILSLLETNERIDIKPMNFNLWVAKYRQYIVNKLKLNKSFIYQRNKAFSYDEVKNYSKELMKYQLDFYKYKKMDKESLLLIKCV